MIRRFPATGQSVAAVRRLTRDTLSGSERSPEAVDDAVLIVSELASNVVEHAQTQYDVAISIVGDCARIEVADGSAVIPDVRDVEHDSERGRGLRLLATLAQAWGIERRPVGKAVWFEVDLTGAR